MARLFHPKLYIFVMFTIFLCSYSKKRKHRLSSQIQCVAPIRLVHYRKIDEKYPCFVKCKLGPYKYCPPGKLLFCDKGDKNCECEAPTQICEPPDLHKFVYAKNKCHCKFNLPYNMSVANDQKSELRREKQKEILFSQ